jgi:hypothetical protein
MPRLSEVTEALPTTVASWRARTDHGFLPGCFMRLFAACPRISVVTPRRVAPISATASKVLSSTAASTALEELTSQIVELEGELQQMFTRGGPMPSVREASVLLSCEVELREGLALRVVTRPAAAPCQRRPLLFPAIPCVAGSWCGQQGLYMYNTHVDMTCDPPYSVLAAHRRRWSTRCVRTSAT